MFILIYAKNHTIKQCQQNIITDNYDEHSNRLMSTANCS